MKTAISIPDDVFEQAERASKRLGVSRSELFTRAMREYLGVGHDAAVTASYNEAFADAEPDDFRDFRRAAAQKVLQVAEWSKK